MRFSYTFASTLPPLAWAARGRVGHEAIEVIHGRYVETRSTFFAEGAWADSFVQGRPDLSDTVFGSGGAIADDGATFVSCTATTDRLFVRAYSDAYAVANSFPLLLAVIGDAAQSSATEYARINRSMLAGIRKLEQDIPTDMGYVQQIVHANIRVSADGLVAIDKPMPPSFADFGEYRRFLDDRVRHLFANARDRTRRRPLEIFSTQSTGYDSTAVNALTRLQRIDRVFTCSRSKEQLSFFLGTDGGPPSDDGAPICGRLGLSCVQIDRLGFQRDLANEHYYWAARDNNQDLNLHQIQTHMNGPTLLLTGNHGEIWYTVRAGGEARTQIINDELIRGDPSGFGLGEVRLQSGFVQAAIPYVGARRRRDILEITESPEMAPWRLGNNYDRPIPRRIAEEAGVPREMFGQVKLASIVHLPTPNLPVTPELRAEFLRHLRNHGLLGPIRAALIPWVQRINNWIYWSNPDARFANRREHPLLWRIGYYWQRLSGRPLRLNPLLDRLFGPLPRTRLLWGKIDSYLYAFCVNKVRAEYAAHLQSAHWPPVRGGAAAPSCRPPKTEPPA